MITKKDSRFTNRFGIRTDRVQKVNINIARLYMYVPGVQTPAIPFPVLKDMEMAHWLSALDLHVHFLFLSIARFLCQYMYSISVLSHAHPHYQ